MNFNYLILLGFVLLSLGQRTYADVLYAPQICKATSISLKNLSLRPQRIWLQKRLHTQLLEEDFLLGAQTETTIDMTSESYETLYSLVIDAPLNTDAPSILSELHCENQNYLFQQTFDAELVYKTKNSEDLLLTARNIFTSENSITIQYLDRKHQVLSEQNFKIDGLAVQNLILKPITPFSFIKIFSKEKSAFHLILKNEVLNPFIIQPKKTIVDSHLKYFLVSPKIVLPGTEQFIVQISEPQMIQKAQQQIDHPDSEKIIFATLKPGSQGINRNLNSQEKSLWTWSIGEVTNISDLASTACNGTPRFVEDYLTQWLNDPTKICFWNYRIIREVTPEEVSTGISPYFP